MDRDTYHHGDLKQQLIDNGIILLNKEGIEGFSLRKVANLCGVSHNAPYKHFKDKESLIYEIIMEVWQKFYTALKSSTEKPGLDAKTQLLEMGKAYVKFMVENPEYLKLIFLSDNPSPIIVQDGEFKSCKDFAFEVFKNCAYNCFDSMKVDKNIYAAKTLAAWSIVHGIAVLIVKKSIDYRGDYLELVENMVLTSL